MRTPVHTDYIELDERGRPWVVDANIRVEEIVINKLAHNWEAEEIQRNLPHLTLAQIHAAFAYYYEHQAEIDRQVEEGDRFVEEFFRNQPETPLRKRLRDLGIRP
jgi:uncharacterized protein (DUF433 family)